MSKQYVAFPQILVPTILVTSAEMCYYLFYCSLTLFINQYILMKIFRIAYLAFETILDPYSYSSVINVLSNGLYLGKMSYLAFDV